MRSLRTHISSGSRRRFASGILATTVILAACGGSDSGSGADSGDPLPEVADSAPAGDDASSAPAPAATGTGYVDLVGPDVVAAAEIETNLLPSVVVDDLTNDRKVNFRNLVPQDKPVLLWMYAPH